MSTRQEINAAKMQQTFVLPGITRFAGHMAPSSPIPTYAQVNEYIPEICGLPYDYLFAKDGTAMAECTLLTWEYLGLDVLGSNHDFYNFEAESIGAKLNFYEKHIPDIDRNDFFIKDERDLDKIKFHGLDSGRYRYLIEYCHAYTKYIGVDVVPSFCAPWSLASNLHGLENLVVAAITEPEFVHEMLRRIVFDLQGPMLRAIAEEIPGFATISVADAWASLPMVSQELHAEFVEPYTLKLSEAMGAGIPVSSSGIWGSSYLQGEARDKFMDFVVKLGGYTTAFDPDQDKVGVEYYRKYADRVGAPVLLGFSTTLLRDGTIEDIVERTKRYTLGGKNGATPMLFFYNNIAPNTPIDNVRASIAAVRTYGEPGATEATPFELPPPAESFEEFLVHKLAHNAEGYEFEWLKRSKYAHLTADIRR